jgi:hypothetical protein
MGRGAMRIHRHRGTREEEPPSAGADDGIPHQDRRRARLLLAPARIFSLIDESGHSYTVFSSTIHHPRQGQAFID